MTPARLTRFSMLGGGFMLLSACAVLLPEESVMTPEEDLAITKQVQYELMSERPAATAAEAAVLFRAVCLDQAPSFERSSTVLNQMPEIEINADSGYQHINLNISFLLLGGDGNKRCVMTFNSDEEADAIEAEFLESISLVPGITYDFRAPSRRTLNIYTISVQAAPVEFPPLTPVTQ